MKHTKSTTSTTRSQGILDRFHGRIKRVANRYRSARQALLALDPKERLATRWKHYFLELKEGDICGPDRETNEPSEGHFQQSWIWTVLNPQPNTSNLMSSDPQLSITNSVPPNECPLSSASTGEGLGGTAVDDKEQEQSHRAHWAQAQARAEHYEEEVKLTVEEMGRTLKYFTWKKSWWKFILSKRGQSNNPPPREIQEKLHAYTHQQSYIYNRLITLFINNWHNFLSAHSLGSSWLHDYPLSAHPVPPAHPHCGHWRLDAGLSFIPDTPQRPTASLETANPIPQEFVSQQSPPISTIDNNTDAPLDGGSSNEDSNYDLPPDDSWGEDSADDD